MLVVFDGPEKAGKSTIISKAKQLFAGTEVRPWGPVESEQDYWPPLLADASKANFCIWDRGWASEHVYAKLLGRDRLLGQDPWFGEWKFGRIADATGVKIMIIPADYADAAKRRDDTDLPVDAYLECQAFKDYGVRFGYHVLYNEYTERSDDENIEKIYRLMIHRRLAGPLQYPFWLGPRDAKVIFMTGTPRDILPFNGPIAEQIGRALGDDALKCAWVSTGQPKELLEYRTVVLVGQLDSNLSLANNTEVLYLNIANDHKQLTQIVKKVKEII